jgi:hypothetical protein
MSKATKSLRGSRLLTVAGLVVAAAGIAFQRVAGVEMPAIPPGLVMLLVAAALITFTRWRWAPALGALVALAEVIAVTIGASDVLTDLSPVGTFLATWVRTIGAATAVGAGVTATVTGMRRSSGSFSHRHMP